MLEGNGREVLTSSEAWSSGNPMHVKLLSQTTPFPMPEKVENAGGMHMPPAAPLRGRLPLVARMDSNVVFAECGVDGKHVSQWPASVRHWELPFLMTEQSLSSVLLQHEISTLDCKLSQPSKVSLDYQQHHLSRHHAGRLVCHWSP